MPEQPCAFHPDRLTAVTCTNCGRAICPDDMIEAPVGYQCPICTGRAREGAIGAASYRTRSAVSRRADRLPFMRVIRGAGVTQTLIAANVALFVGLVATGSWNVPGHLLDWGALQVPLPASQWWRLITAMFVHIGPLHLLFNMYALFLFGPAVENRYGRLRFLALYLASGFLGSAFSIAFTSGAGVRAGASGGVFGILGCWIAFYVRHRNVRGSSDQLRSLFFLVGINLFFGFSIGGIDNYAHLGGLAGGFVVGTGFELWARARGDTGKLAALAGFAIVIGVGVFALMASGRVVSGTPFQGIPGF
ncbi:MAG: rhomboid family intramembrane serine protease [Actinomycetota bacterium]